MATNASERSHGARIRYYPRVKILVLGNSDTAGEFVHAKTWTRVAADVVTEQSGETAEITEVRFGAIGARAAEVAERKVREFEPDLVILPAGTFAYTVGFVGVQVRHRFGKRAGRLYKRLEGAFEQRTGSGNGGQPGGAKAALNHAGRKLARTVIGARPLTTQEELTEGFRQVLHAIARVEAVDVLLVAYPAETGRLANKKLATPARRMRFLADIRQAAEAHHYRLLVADRQFAAHPEGSLITADGFHLNEAGHRVLGEAVAAAILERAERPGVGSQARTT